MCAIAPEGAYNNHCESEERDRNIHSHPRLHQNHWPIPMTEILFGHCNVMNHDQEASQLGEINVNKIELRRVLLLEEIGAKVRIE